MRSCRRERVSQLALLERLQSVPLVDRGPWARSLQRAAPSQGGLLLAAAGQPAAVQAAPASCASTRKSRPASQCTSAFHSAAPMLRCGRACLCDWPMLFQGGRGCERTLVRLHVCRLAHQPRSSAVPCAQWPDDSARPQPPLHCLRRAASRACRPAAQGPRAHVPWPIRP